MTITSLVMSSGGTNGYLILGAIELLTQNKHIDLNNITSMYTTSAGSLIGILLSMEKNVDTIRDYVLNFPIKNIFKYDVDSIVELYNNKGIFGEEVILKLLKSSIHIPTSISTSYGIFLPFRKHPSNVPKSKKNLKSNFFDATDRFINKFNKC